MSEFVVVVMMMLFSRAKHYITTYELESTSYVYLATSDHTKNLHVQRKSVIAEDDKQRAKWLLSYLPPRLSSRSDPGDL